MKLWRPPVDATRSVLRHAANVLLALVWSLVVIAGPVQAKTNDRIALVIGNADYQNVAKLANPLNDAQTLADKLSSLGFAVTHLKNQDRLAMTRAIAGWLAKTEPEQTAVIYFAGHGIEVQGSNYLLPVDVPLLKVGEEGLLRTEALSLDNLLADVINAPVGRGIVILDACRNNPMSYGTRSVGASRGMARVDNPFGTFVMYAAGARQTALDDAGSSSDNGLFTKMLLKHLDDPGLELRRLAIKVRDEVARVAKTDFGHQQVPSYYDQMTGDFFFNSRSVARLKPKVSPPPTPKYWPVDSIRAAVDGSTIVFEGALETIYFSSKLKNTLTEHLGPNFMRENIRKDVVVQMPFLAKIRTKAGEVQYIEGIGGIATGTKKGGSAVFLLQSTAADKTIDRFSASDRLFATLRLKGDTAHLGCTRSDWRSLFGFKGKLAVSEAGCALHKGNHLIAQ